MKHWFLFILVISWFCFPLSGQQTNRPDWVKQHPVSGLSYIGIGMAEISEGDYQQKAKQNALSDLVSEIQVVIAANSLLNTLEALQRTSPGKPCRRQRKTMIRSWQWYMLLPLLRHCG